MSGDSGENALNPQDETDPFFEAYGVDIHAKKKLKPKKHFNVHKP